MKLVDWRPDKDLHNRVHTEYRQSTFRLGDKTLAILDMAPSDSHLGGRASRDKQAADVAAAGKAVKEIEVEPEPANPRSRLRLTAILTGLFVGIAPSFLGRILLYEAFA